MKKLLFSLSLIFVFNIFTYADINKFDTEDKIEIKTSTFDDGTIVNYTIDIDKYDICTITVTITMPSGNSYSATASNNRGNCAAAAQAAEDEARNMAAVLEPA